MASLWNCGYRMVRCAAKSRTVSLVTLSETVKSPQDLLVIADVAKPVGRSRCPSGESSSRTM